MAEAYIVEAVRTSGDSGDSGTAHAGIAVAEAL